MCLTRAREREREREMGMGMGMEMEMREIQNGLLSGNRSPRLSWNTGRYTRWKGNCENMFINTTHTHKTTHTQQIKLTMLPSMFN